MQKLIRNHRNDQSGADPNAIPLKQAQRYQSDRQPATWLPAIISQRMTCAARKIRGRPTLFTNRNVTTSDIDFTSFNVPEQTKKTHLARREHVVVEFHESGSGRLVQAGSLNPSHLEKGKADRPECLLTV